MEMRSCATSLAFLSFLGSAHMGVHTMILSQGAVSGRLRHPQLLSHISPPLCLGQEMSPFSQENNQSK